MSYLTRTRINHYVRQRAQMSFMVSFNIEVMNLRTDFDIDMLDILDGESDIEPVRVVPQPSTAPASSGARNLQTHSVIDNSGMYN